MERSKSEQAEREFEPAPRAPWVKPEIGTLEAGAAELGDIINADGGALLS